MKRAFVWSIVSAIMFASLVVAVPAFARFIIPPNDRIVRSCPTEEYILKPVEYHGLSEGNDSQYRCVPAERYIQNHK